MIIYKNGKENIVYTLQELEQFVDKKGVTIGKCCVCEEICNTQTRDKRFVCSPECMGG